MKISRDNTRDGLSISNGNYMARRIREEKPFPPEKEYEPDMTDAYLIEHEEWLALALRGLWKRLEEK